MKKRIAIVTTIAALALVAAVPMVYAQRGRFEGHGHGDNMLGILALGRLEKAKEKLGLTDAQTAQIKQIAVDLKQQNAPYRAQLRGGILNIAQTLVKDPNNVSAAQSLIDQQSDAERVMKTNALNAASKALNVLTPDQRVKVGELIAARAAKHRQ
jgi:Spy/CpxP family protein refolding chaperone